MDILQGYALQAFNLYTNVTSTPTTTTSISQEQHQPTIPNLHNHITTYLAALAPLKPYLTPLTTTLQTQLTTQPLLTSFLLLLFTLFISLQLLNLARRFFFWVIRLCLKIMFWGAVVVVAVKVAQRGVGESLGDAVRWGEEVRRVWWREYQRWDGVGRVEDGGGKRW